jgi:hypothetical protein
MGSGVMSALIGTHDAYVIVACPWGCLALTLDQLHDARSLADSLLRPASDASPSGEVAPRAPLLDAEQTSLRLGVKAGWLLAQAREGRISSVKLGRYIRFDVAKLVSEFEREPW